MEQSAEIRDAEVEMPLNRMITYRLSRINARITAQATRILRQNSDLSLMQWRILVAINTMEKATHSKIVAATQLDGGQTSRTIRAMLESGLLRTRTHESDSRQQYLSITPKGARLYSEARPHMRHRQKAFLGTLSPEEASQFFDMLDRLERVAEEEAFSL